MSKRSKDEPDSNGILLRIEQAGNEGISSNTLTQIFNCTAAAISKVLFRFLDAGLVVKKNKKTHLPDGRILVENAYYKAPPGFQPPKKQQPKQNGPFFPYASPAVQQASHHDLKDVFTRFISDHAMFEHHRSEIPPNPIQITPHLTLGLGIHFPRTPHPGIEPLDLILRILPLNEVTKDNFVLGSIIGPAEYDDFVYVYALFASNAFPDPGPLDALMAAAADHVRKWITNGFDFDIINKKSDALRLMLKLARAGDDRAADILQDRINEALDPTCSTTDDRIAVIKSCGSRLARRHVYDLLGDPDPAVRTAAAQHLVPLRPRDPGDDFVPLSLADLTPDEQELLRLLRKTGNGTFVHDPVQGTLQLEIILQSTESPPHARFSCIPTASLAVNATISGLLSKRLLASYLLGGPRWYEVKLVDW